MDMRCGICMESYTVTTRRPMVLQPCGHGVCALCSTFQTCPMCRAPVLNTSPNYDLQQYCEAEGVSSSSYAGVLEFEDEVDDDPTFEPRKVRPEPVDKEPVLGRTAITNYYKSNSYVMQRNASMMSKYANADPHLVNNKWIRTRINQESLLETGSKVAANAQAQSLDVVVEPGYVDKVHDSMFQTDDFDFSQSAYKKYSEVKKEFQQRESNEVPITKVNGRTIEQIASQAAAATAANATAAGIYTGLAVLKKAAEGGEVGVQDVKQIGTGMAVGASIGLGTQAARSGLEVASVALRSGGCAGSGAIAGSIATNFNVAFALSATAYQAITIFRDYRSNKITRTECKDQLTKVGLGTAGGLAGGAAGVSIAALFGFMSGGIGFILTAAACAAVGAFTGAEIVSQWKSSRRISRDALEAIIFRWFAHSDEFAHACRILALDPERRPSKEDIDRKFRQLALMYHPDRPGGSEEEFIRLEFAKCTLYAELGYESPEATPIARLAS